MDRSIDPVDDFLVNRKAGHCEYFASALALLLRSIDIQARIVNGFKGGDWNELTQLSMCARSMPIAGWKPIRGSARTVQTGAHLDHPGSHARRRAQESIAQVGGLAGKFRPLTDLVRHIWVFYVVGYNGERQNRLIYTPMRTIIREARDQYVKLGQWLRRWFARLFHFRDISAFISLRGFIVSFFVVFLLAALATPRVPHGQALS